MPSYGRLGHGGGSGGGGRGGRGLTEPLLLPRSSSGAASGQQQNPNHSDDVESGTTNPQDSDANTVPVIQRPYRRTTCIVALVDLLLIFAIGYYLQEQEQGPLVDIACVGVSLVRSISIIIQSARYESLLSAKIVGYASLLSLLFLITKLCYIESVGHSTTMLLVTWISLAINTIECILELLISTYSTIDKSTSSAPSASEAARGIAIDTENIPSISMWELLSILKPYFWPTGLGNRICVFATWLCLIGSKGANILAPLCIANATDALTNNNHSSVSYNVIIYAVLLFLNKLLKEGQALSYIRVKLTAGVQLKERVFTHLLNLSIDWHQRKSTGAAVLAMERGIGASSMVVQYIFLYLFPTLIEAMVVSIVFVENFHAPVLAAVAISGCTIYVCVTIELTLYRMQFRKSMNKADNDASNKVTDAILNIETVKYFTGEKHEVERYRDCVEDFKDSAGKIQFSLSILNSTQQLVLNLTLVVALLVAAHEYTIGDFSVGQFVAVNVYVMQLFAPLNFLGSIYSMAVGSYVDLQNLCNILAEKVDIEDRDDAEDLDLVMSRRRETEGGLSSSLEETNQNGTVLASSALSSSTLQQPSLGIEFRNVVFAYPSRKDVDVLKGVSFTVPEGTVTAIVGATGSGKSTLTRLLFRLYETKEGEILVGGKNVLNLTQSSLRKNIGVVPQDHALFNDTLYYNIQYGAGDKTGGTDDSTTDRAVQKAVDATELSDFVSSLPQGLETIVGERGQQLSGGQKQRLAIARVLMKDCPIVVLDEATSSLDSRTEQLIQSSLDCLSSGGRTMMIIAHRLSTIQHADQIIVFSSGEILESGSHEDLLKKGMWHESCYASLWDKQKKAE